MSLSIIVVVLAWQLQESFAGKRPMKMTSGKRLMK
jgi:hypothetical protein